MRLLIVESDLILLDLLANGLSSNFKVDFATNWSKAKQLLGENNYRVVILKQSLAEAEKNDLKQFVNRNDLAFLLMVDGLACVMHLKSLKNHVYDFIIKPFTLEQLANKLNGFLISDPSSLKLSEKNIIRSISGALVLNKNQQSISCEQGSLRLNSKEFSLLSLLVKRHGQVLSKTILASLVWEKDSTIFSNSIATHITSLRSKLKKIDCPQNIKTIRGSGYFWSNN